MLEFIGLLLIALAFSVVAVATPWFQAHAGEQWVDRWMLGEFLAVSLVAVGSVGGALLLDAAITAWQHHSVVEIGTVAASLIIGLPAIFMGSRWLGRRLARSHQIPVA